MKLKWALFSSKNQQGIESVNAMARVIGWDALCVEDDGKLKPDHKALLLEQVKALGIKVAEGENPFFMIPKSGDCFCRKLTHVLYFEKLEQVASDAIKAIDSTTALMDPGTGIQGYIQSALWSQYVDSIGISFGPDPQGNNVVATLSFPAFAAQGRAVVSQQRVDSQEPSAAASADNNDGEKHVNGCPTQ